MTVVSNPTAQLHAQYQPVVQVVPAVIVAAAQWFLHKEEEICKAIDSLRFDER